MEYPTRHEAKRSETMNISVLASGSEANCAVICTERSKILVDAGLSAKQTYRSLLQIGIDPESLTGIVISHEHCDHTAGLQVIASDLRVPIYLTTGTALEVKWRNRPSLQLFDVGDTFQIGDITVSPFEIPHDAREPVGFVFEADGQKLGFATDVGRLEEPLMQALADCQTVVIESNYCGPMLMAGDYPTSLKKRTSGGKGHLSNDEVAWLITNRLRATKIILAHLSRRANTVELAWATAEAAIGERECELYIARPEGGTIAFRRACESSATPV